ncbi:nephrocystin-4 isoform X3 [Phyllopteryx taeniolatus]|uniref:nephrocystin-4 isoform X3 n=1 Tax=Phyllopteryx taeniolatus TaxID=161469 RepID=UPI002AD21D94|nr:nephrocystin-4 isoform X3 [Phyllopteryx taeniolatus]
MSHAADEREIKMSPITASELIRIYDAPVRKAGEPTHSVANATSMVKTEDLASMADCWRDVFERGRLIPPVGQALRQAADSHLTQSHGVQLTLSRLTAAHPPKETPEAESDVTYQLRVTFFDRNHQYFFGRTWKSTPQKMKNNKMTLNEILYFHTSLRLPSTVLVLELVALSTRSDSSQQALGQGFTVLDLFPNKMEPQGDRRLNLLHGSPRVLLHPLLKDVVDYSAHLKAIDEAHVECVLKGHPALTPMMHLLPENVLVSSNENIPGLATSPTGDGLSKPMLLKMLPFTLSRLTICLQPSLEAFESQLLQLINADCQNTPSQEGSLKTVVIQERRLHVGVHNGWGFIDTPQIMVLEPLASGVKGRVDSVSKQGTQTKDSSAASSAPQTLGLRSNLELRLIDHQAVAVVFQLEYVFSAPIGRETMLSATSTSRAAFLQCLRWAMLCPFQEQTDWKGEETQLVLQGGSKPNPLGVMVYNSAITQSAAPPSTLGTIQDVIKFRLAPTLDRTTSSPKTSLKTKLEDSSRHGRSSSSPTQSQNDIQAVSSPESPRGPKLSLSQLTATSCYPPISHSSSGLPWQQSFPSLLHSSLTAPAQQPSHVAISPSLCAHRRTKNKHAEPHPAVSSIAHLEMDHHPVRDGTHSPNHEEDQLQELPFMPVHAPVITVGVTAPSLSTVSSRSSLAHLYSAGFPNIVDLKGQVADVLDPTEPVPFDLHREEIDPLQENLLVFQFLAFTRMPVVGIGPEYPLNIYFTFQFYRFPPVTSQQLRLLNSDRVKQKASELLPCVLSSINNDGTLNSESPGLQVQFRVDDSFLKPGEKRWFLRYLALHTMHVDIWDSDSLLLIGSTALELKYMLRHGKTAVQALHEVDVLTTDYVGEETLQTGNASNNPMAVHTIVRGRLHVRTGNIGSPADLSKRRTADRMQSHSHIIIPREITGGFTGGSLSTRNILQLNVRNTAQAQILQVEEECGQLYMGRINNHAIFSGEKKKLDSGRRKLERMAAVHQKESKKEGSKTTCVMDGAKEVTLTKQPFWSTCYEDIDKAEGISNMLSHAITTPHQLFTSLGSAEYMEFVLKNPFNSPQTVTIHSSDPELSVITNTEEWQYFKELTQTPTSLEKDMFHLEEGAPGPKVYLRPKESVHIPLKYQSFVCDHNMTTQGPSVLPPSKSSNVAKKILSNIAAAKTIKVSFKAENGDPIAICQAIVEPSPHIVDQTFRLYHLELSFLKKAIRLPPWHTRSAVGGSDTKTHISVRCSDPNIICQTRMLKPGEPQDVYLKIPGGPSPNIKMFFVMVFTDKWMAAPSQIWQMYVHFMERVDVSCITGQRSCQSVVLRGRQAPRKVKCFSSHPQEIEVNPGGVFMLPPAGVQELQLKVQPWRVGTRFLYVNAVDVEQRQLVTAWLLCLNVHRPVLSKAFEVCVPVSGRGSSKKITYVNPYTSSRTFLLRSDHPDLLQFKEDKFQLDGGESYTIGLRFAPSLSPGSVEILVYVNNLEEKTEETFFVKVTYS